MGVYTILPAFSNFNRRLFSFAMKRWQFYYSCSKQFQWNPIGNWEKKILQKQQQICQCQVVTWHYGCWSMDRYHFQPIPLSTFQLPQITGRLSSNKRQNYGLWTNYYYVATWTNANTFQSNWFHKIRPTTRSTLASIYFCVCFFFTKSNEQKQNA